MIPGLPEDNEIGHFEDHEEFYELLRDFGGRCERAVGTPRRSSGNAVEMLPPLLDSRIPEGITLGNRRVFPPNPNRNEDSSNVGRSRNDSWGYRDAGEVSVMVDASGDRVQEESHGLEGSGGSPNDNDAVATDSVVQSGSKSCVLNDDTRGNQATRASPGSASETGDQNGAETALERVHGQPIDGVVPEPPALGEIEPEFRSNDEYTQLLVRTSRATAIYAGSAGPVDDEIAKRMRIDTLYIPVREDNVFKEGPRKSRCTKHVVVHASDMMSHAYLSTHREGVLHVIPGWDGASFIDDISYRYDAKYVQHNVKVPFLGGVLCTVRTYFCVGVKICPNCPDYIRKNVHIDVSPEDKNLLEAVEDTSPIAEARKKVEGIYKEVMGRQVHCGVPKPQADGSVVACRGGPVIKRCRAQPSSQQRETNGLRNPLSRPRRVRPNAFIGCTEFHPRDPAQHYNRTLWLEEPEVGYLQKLFDGTEKLTPVAGACTYVQQKRKSSQKCPRHGLELIEIPCTLRPNDKVPVHTMCTIEPKWGKGGDPRYRVLYVSCVGEHVHPAPPPPDVTLTKLRIVEDVYASNQDWTNFAQLRKEVQLQLMRFKKSKTKNKDGSSSVSGQGNQYEGNLALPAGAMRRRIQRLQQKIPKIAIEVGELSVMAADCDMTYVRDVKRIDGGHVVLLGTDEGLMHASQSMAFAGDATFKTVTDRNRSVKDGRWYLYNIMVMGSTDRLNEKGIVVLRALMTGLSKEYYYAVWKYFFDTLIRANNVVNGVRDAIDVGSIRLPYFDVAERYKDRACWVSSVTMDFDAAEIKGCAEAVSAVCGGGVDMHLENLFLGCKVHLMRDIIRLASKGEKQTAAEMTYSQLYDAYMDFCEAETKEGAKIAFEKLKKLDPHWTKWVEDQGMGPLLCNALSGMSAHSRSLAFSDTNGLESQNRRGNVYVGTHLSPAVAARKLFELDVIDLQNLKDGQYNRISKNNGRARKRSDSILRPVPLPPSTTKRRAAKGGGPVQKKTRRKKGATRSDRTEAQNEGTMQDGRGGNGGGEARGAPPRNVNHERADHIMQMLASLQSGLNSPNGGPPSPEDSARRLDVLVNILSGVHGANGDMDAIKNILLTNMANMQNDPQLKMAVFKIFNECVRASSGMSPAGRVGGDRRNPTHSDSNVTSGME